MINLLFSTAILILFVFLTPRLITALYARNRIFTLENLSGEGKVAIVFGAGLWRDGRLTPVLSDRVTTAAQLYFTGKVKILLMSGDNRFANYNEPAAMQRYALELGVPKEAIVLDYAGRRTYDTCYRAKNIFKIEDAILITQGFHLPRAIYTCNRLGVNSIGVVANLRQYSHDSTVYWNIRELPATLIAMWQVHISHPVPLLGDPQPIFPLEAQ
jgi:SanA protein